MLSTSTKRQSSRRTKDPDTRPNTRGLILHTARAAPVKLLDGPEPPPAPRVPGQIDPGIRKAVEVLQKNNIETFEACEGGQGHAYPEPTVAFYGTPEAGWRAVGLACRGGLPCLWAARTIPQAGVGHP
jgi:hypothetical protein